MQNLNHFRCGSATAIFSQAVHLSFRKVGYNPIIHSEKWAVSQLFIQKNGLGSCFFVWKSVFLQRKFV